MVAGSRTNGRRGFGDGDVSWLPSVRAATRPLNLTWRRAGVWAPLLGLYALAALALLLPWPFGAHPPQAYNWEGYTAWRWSTYWEPPHGPAVEVWAPTDGLMTESGQGPLVGLPVTIGVTLGGFNLDAMRFPVTLLAAAAVPLLWLLGRRLLGEGPATLAALLLATSPVFLVYGRTATLVGVSLVPLLFMALALARVLDAGADDRWRWRREGLLAASLLLGVYAYAPVRLFWPLAVAALVLAAARTPARRGVLLKTALLCALAVPAAVMALEQATAAQPDPLAAALGYFHARGEQFVAMGANPVEAGSYLRTPALDAEAGWQPLRLLVMQNATDLGNLVRDHGTGPVPVDFWNERGRFWPWFFAPFAVVGAAAAGWTALRRRTDPAGSRPSWLGTRATQASPLQALCPHGSFLQGDPTCARQGMAASFLPAALALGLALPLLLTSRVHVGRLLPALPFALLVVAAGVWVVAGELAKVAQRVGAAEAARWIAPWLAGAILLPAIASARVEMASPVGESRESRIAAAMAAWQDEARERGGAVLIEPPDLGDEIERVHAATYRLGLDDVYRFIDLQNDAAEAGVDPRPPLSWRGALAALQDGKLARPCDRLWFVMPEIAEVFFAAWRASGCAGVPDSVILP